MTNYMEITKTEIKSITLQNKAGLELTLLNYGATIQSLKVPNANGAKTDVVVGLLNAEDYTKNSYKKHNIFLGSSVGRYAGRISGGKFSIENEIYKIPVKNGLHLHGGNKGFDKKLWTIETFSEDHSSVTFSYESKHLEERYPGHLKVSVTYSLEDTNLDITYKATTDKTTVVNLTNHAYFNLDGCGSILKHQLQINNTHHLDVDGNLHPSGKLLSSDKTRFDFKKESIINREDFKGFDDTFVLGKDKIAASLSSKESGIKMVVITNQPALVIYTKDKFPAVPISADYTDYPAICFEAQNFPDAPNNKNFPSSILQPDEVYENKTRFSFSLVS